MTRKAKSVTGRTYLTLDRSIEARLGERIQPQTNGCWLFDGSKQRADTSIDAQRLKIYRFVYETLVGPIPEGLIAHHTCETPGCVNPDHIELLTPGDHSRTHAALRAARR